MTTPTRSIFKTAGIHFTRWLWFFWPLRFFIRVKESPESFSREKFLAGVGDAAVIYVLPRFVLIDVFVLWLSLRGHKLVRPSEGAMPGRFRHAALLAIRYRKGLINPSEPREAFTEQVAHLLRSDPRASARKLVLQPVTVFFTRSAERSERNFVLRSLFPDDENATTIQKLVFLLLHGGVVRVHFGERYVLGESHAQSSDGEAPVSRPADSSTEGSRGAEIVEARRLRRALLIDFARERTSVMGPTLYEVDSIANWIFKSDSMRKLLESEPRPEKAQRKALKFLEEIAAKYNYSTIRALEKVFDFLWTRIFKGVRVRNFEAVAGVARQGQLLWMPCHRSHLDYMLLSYVLFKNGLVTPHILAGANLSFWPAGPILRRGGAFFMRRSFSGNKLYAAVLSKYVEFLMHHSFPVEFFHEGGRSRIGKLLSPKFGFLSICVSSILKRRAGNTYIIPVYFGYDKVMEDGAYAKELGGAKKQKESLWQVLRSIRFLFSNYGRVDVSFGTPMHFGDAWKEFFSQAANPDVPGSLPADLTDIPEGVGGRDPRVQAFVRALARRVNQGINSTAIASGSSTLTSALLAQTEVQVPRARLVERVRMLQGIVNRLGQDGGLIGWTVQTSSVGEGELVAAPLGEETKEQRERALTVTTPLPASGSIDALVEEILATGLKWEFMVESQVEGEVVLSRNSAKELNLWWYRGTVFHVLALPGLLASFLLDVPAGEEVRLARIESRLQALRTLWDEELYWPDATSTATFALAGLRVLEELGLCTQHSESVCIRTEQHAIDKLRFLADLVRPERELYALQISTALVLMETRGRFSREELLRKTLEAHRSAFLRGVASHPANLSRVFASRTFEALFKAGVFVPGENQLLTVAYTEIMSVSDFFQTQVFREFVETDT